MTPAAEPALHLLSLGAGVQSTTLALLSAAGDLPHLDGAIFADTGWEPRAVYDHLDRLEQEVLGPAGIPLYRVAKGNLRDDLLNPDKMSMIPAYTLGPEYMVTVIDLADPCPLGCRWAVFLGERDTFTQSLGDLVSDPDDDEDDGHEAAWARFEREYPRPADCRSCGNTGRIVVVSHEEPRRDKGMQGRKCTTSYKLGPIRTQTRLLLGASREEPRECRHCTGTGVRVAPWRAKRGEDAIGRCSVCDGGGTVARAGQPAAGVWAEQWVGFSTDEIIRVSGHSDTRYVRSRYPLLELGMSRTQCISYLEHHGWDSVEKSACIGCPYHGNRHWREMRARRDACGCGHPRSEHWRTSRTGCAHLYNRGAGDDEAAIVCACQEFRSNWDAAVEFDSQYRAGIGMKSQRFLHISCKPLDEAPIDVVRRGENEQTDLLDVVYAARLEEGEPDGCSPHGCRTETGIGEEARNG
jgi:hypothetical protein